jgi:alkylation response protein AidB-like acyl-CoA dehydrogenase
LELETFLRLKGANYVSRSRREKLIVGGSFLLEERTPEEVFTPEDFTEEHRMIAETTREFMDNEVRPATDELERKNWELSRELIRKAAELGMVSVNIPEEYGGLGSIKRAARLSAN